MPILPWERFLWWAVFGVGGMLFGVGVTVLFILFIGFRTRSKPRKP